MTAGNKQHTKTMKETQVGDRFGTVDLSSDLEIRMQQRINIVSKELAELRDNVKRAKESLTHIVDHWDEYGQGNLRNQITGIVEEVL